MPGMLDTVLNLGINDVTVKSLSENFGERFAYDSYRRFLNMFGDVVLNIPHHSFESEMKALKESKNITEDSNLTADDFKELVKRYKSVYEKHGQVFPDDPLEQLYFSISAVFSKYS